ncbi:MAG: M4 family metallopeptidase [Candidatus Aminicenantia bacterium]
MKKRKFGWVVIAILSMVIYSFSFQVREENATLEGEKVIKLNQGQSIFTSDIEEVGVWNNLIDRELAVGNLKLALTQTEEVSNYIHHRYDQYYQGIKVWGAQLIRHLKEGRVYCINGRYYRDIDIGIQPSLETEVAIQIVRDDLLDADYQLFGKPELMIFPAEKEYYLTYRLIFEKPGSEMIYFVNSHTGEVILKYDNIKTVGEIGLGTGVHNDTKKFSADYGNPYGAGTSYWARDVMRPARLETVDMRNTWWSGWYVSDSDNQWTDGALVDAHCYSGWVYDYFYNTHGRKGINNSNMFMRSWVHLGVNYNNAYWSSTSKAMFYGDGDGVTYYPFSAALDVVAHEITHGVTQYTSNLIYWFYSGALNEAFSDIMGGSCEFYHQPTGNGYLRAEWWLGEDLYRSFRPMRRFDKPYLLLVWGWFPYPDHYSLRYTGWGDNRGVHINSSIANHWFYLLAHGGTNRISSIHVTGIGISKAEKIAYRAWTRYLFPSANFSDARSACVQAARDLYGTGSTEASRTALAWTAVGVF